MIDSIGRRLRIVAVVLGCSIAPGVFADTAVPADAHGACELLDIDLRASRACALPTLGLRERLSEAERLMKDGQFDAGERALDCATRAVSRAADPKTRYDLARLRGILAFRREDVETALPYYACAGAVALERGDRDGYAKMLNNSAAAWRRLDNHKRALTLLHESIRIRERAGIEPSGANWLNLADVYQTLGEIEKAAKYYEASYRAYEKAGEPGEMAHVRETMATYAAERGEVAQAKRWLQEAVSLSSRQGAKAQSFMLRTYAALIDLALREDDLAAARRWVDVGQAFASAHPDLAMPVDFALHAARLDMRERDYDDAERRLSAALDALSTYDADRTRVVEAQADVRQAKGDLAAALRDVREALAEERERYASLQNAQTKAIRIRVDRDRAVVDSRARAQALDRRFRAFVIAVAVVAGLVAVAILRVRWRARLREVERRARHDEEIARYRRLADELRVDRAVLEASLDSRDDAVCVIDGRGHVVAANRRAAEALDTDVAGCVGGAFAERLPEAARPAFVAALERLDDGIVERIAYRRERDDTTWYVEPSDRRYGDGAIFLRLVPAAANSAQPPAVDPSEAHSAGDSREGFHAALVELMLSAVGAWERSMGLNRLELAERSRIWRVSVDDGRLRARTMDRYLSLAKFPQNPHWRDVLRTAYFVLAQCPLDEEPRAELQRRVEAVLGYTRRDAMV